ncbi:MAG: hypothetical protein IPN17_35145 [Deltaproteobacteria bacterium]|nr:hypothetical protein [Deltaproteobacteria bacterium]
MILALLLTGGCTGNQFGGPMIVPGRYLGSSGGVSTYEAVPLGDSGFRYLLAMNVGVATGSGTGSPGGPSSCSWRPTSGALLASADASASSWRP